MMFNIQALVQTFRWQDIVDILIVWILLYYVYKQLKDTRAVNLVKGLVVLAIINFLSHTFNFYTVNWILQQAMTVLLFALPVVFQPELRRALDKLGQTRLLQKSQNVDDELMDRVISEIMAAAKHMSRQKIGALIVFERMSPLQDIIDTGVKIDAQVSTQLIRNIFIPNTPLHDGAMIIRNGRIMAASCLLPLSENRYVSQELGTRHRAAIGMTEQTDAVVLVVSEETGAISCTYGGHIYRNIPQDQLKETLRSFMARPRQNITSIFKWGGNK